MHKAAGGYGAIRVYSRPRIPVPFAPPAHDFTVLAGDLYKRSHRVSPSVWLSYLFKCFNLNDFGAEFLCGDLVLAATEVHFR